ncbi:MULTISPECIES: phospho-N-acetylmuramoyl-pentapeptide-transferase [Alistipes]|uniref:Phospho-N-acetylmuramoyl-pentapeptide-transferase n=2 Tax=Alistipes TaxID=239759 RepID=A0ABY5VCH4_9BACT|nr:MULTISPECIES: phospho-N-acetylmuramoyl-pentapeptide-transferase [Alistipes]MBD9301608.1 phospho-N-acetylmuramoyl-pentapeptide-transferase [Alistipes senegalensis]MBQ7894648.1 phospho-N-acetylmuramoyl-pentapeptide-transferase [Alistipes sp.]MBR2217467.1 phospho-N-acetylmuramoyl-pentapeptide-transferase [Alistipes sp.]MBS5526118.1 phospho-N-acetylmuramoyl-pentapeptide-transferase [Alistipes sp.]MCI7308856.1 phospho-N-acetylmuramoyl-pentapeptide-transferase [Alistipes senegalensis]
MLYHLFKYLDEAYNLPGSGMFQYLSFRAAAAVILSLLIVIIFGRRIIDFLRRKQIGEEIRDLGLQGQLQKKGTPTMGGVIILIAILVPMLLVGNLGNVYVRLMLVSTVWLGLIGGLDDYIKVFRHRKEGLKGRFKIVGQVGLGIIVGTTMCLSPDIVVREKVTQPEQTVYTDADGTVVGSVQRNVVLSSESLKTTQTTIPFVKNNEFDYGWLTGGNSTATWLLYVLVAIFVVTAVSNGANLTDGLDGLATGVSVPIVAVLGVLAYLSGHIVYADYLNIMYIPDSGELVVFAAALVGALVGFLWYNSFPAQIFMGDTGSLAIGGVIAVFALCIRKELLLPLLCGVFLVESFSVMMQVGYFKYTKRRYGEGRRILLMSPIHHHYQKKGIFETKIVLRFWIISLLLAAITLVTLKIR